MSIETVLRFANLGLDAPILQAIDDIGYESPSPIQAECIPPMLEGRDLLGQAQTGTGKTAAFALPILSRVDTRNRATQALILTPTRELAIQVAEAIHSYAKHLDGLHVLPVYGGQHISAQLRPLHRGVHIVVGTPGRVIDHLERGTLKLNEVKTVVLDEADEMLRMGFIEDVDLILQQTPVEKQIALFSATMPREVRRIADEHLNNPEHIKIESATSTVETVSQHYLITPWRQKLDAMTRILETTDFDGMLVFVRTKVATLELTEKLEARGHACAALNGDMTQTLRERTVQRLKDGSLDIVVATDVAARGLDVSRISHVVNYDIPNDTSAYVHRIGRTGRAGREGEAILLVQPREKRMLRSIERATGQLISPMKLPSTAAVTERRVSMFKQRISDVAEAEDLDFFNGILTSLRDEQELSMAKIAAALAYIVQQDRPLQPSDSESDDQHFEFDNRNDRNDRGDRSRRNDRDRRSDAPYERRSRDESMPTHAYQDRSVVDMETYRLDIGQKHGAQPKHIVGAIANETGLDGRSIGRITIEGTYSMIDLPAGMPKPVFKQMREIEVFGRALRASLLDERDSKTKSSGSSNGGPKTYAGNGGGKRSGGHAKSFDGKPGKFKKNGKPGKGKGKPGKKNKGASFDSKSSFAKSAKKGKGKPKKSKSHY